MTGNILLINPPIEDFYQTKRRQQPLGLEYIAAMLKQQKYQVTILDALLNNSSLTIPIPSELNCVKKFYPVTDLSPFRIFGHYRHFGLSYDDILKQVIAIKPDIIGISANFTPYFNAAVKIATLCKSQLPDVPIVMGGHHVTADPESALTNRYVDYVVLGEGEQIFTQLVRALLGKNPKDPQQLPGIAFLSNGTVQHNPISGFIDQLDALPIPEPSAPDTNRMVITSRGCPRNCNFCSIDKVMGKKIRFRSIDSVIAEIRNLLERGVIHIDFEDDTLTFNRDRAHQLFTALINEFGANNIKLSAQNGIDARHLDEELISLMKQAGFVRLNIPLVSRNETVQQQIHRQQSASHFEHIVSVANQYGLPVTAYIIIGLPEDNLQNMLDDILFLAERQLLIGPSIFYPPPGTRTFENCVDAGYIRKDNYIAFRSSTLPVETERFTRRDLITLFRLCRAVNYLKRLIDDTFTADLPLNQIFQSQVAASMKLNFNHKLTQHEIGELLLLQLFVKKNLRGLKLWQAKNGSYIYDWLDYDHSRTIVNLFISMLTTRKIRGNLTHFCIRFDDNDIS